MTSVALSPNLCYNNRWLEPPSYQLGARELYLCDIIVFMVGHSSLERAGLFVATVV